jgi:dolichol-phosphate mannosyltransferase
MEQESLPNRLEPRTGRTRPEISVVVPLYNEQENLPELYGRLVRTLDEIHCDFELVLVNDGSRDATTEILHELACQDWRIVAIHLSRNFGHQAAVSAGIDHARGRAVILMDGDLQDPPEVLPQFIDAWHAGSDVVYAVRTKRKEGLVRRTCYALFYRLFRAISDLDIPLDSGDFCLMGGQVVDALRQLPERGRFVRGLRSFVGFKQTGLKYERAARQAGHSKYTFKIMFRLAVDGLIGFSSLPLSLVTYAGCCCMALLLAGCGWMAMHAVRHAEVPGWSVATLAVIGCTGLQLLGLGIISEYVRRVFLETKARPTYIVGSIQERPRDGLPALPQRKPRAA